VVQLVVLVGLSFPSLGTGGVRDDQRLERGTDVLQLPGRESIRNAPPQKLETQRASAPLLGLRCTAEERREDQCLSSTQAPAVAPHRSVVQVR
jgi:hypothetical protein